MVISGTSTGATASDALLLREEIVEGVVDYKGRRVNNISKSKYGRWRSASLIIGVEIAERFAYYGISSNLITYLTGPLRQSTVSAAENVNVWSGTASMLPLLGAFVADSYLGRYWTILFSSLLYVLGLGLLTLSAVLTSLNSPECQNTENNIFCSSPSTLQVVFFFISLYLVAIAQAGHKPCVQAFGADQFDGRDPEESKSKSSFFNWWTYRYSFKEEKSNPFVRIAQVFVVAARNWRNTPSSTAMLEEARQTSSNVDAHQFKFLNKALIGDSNFSNDSRKDWRVCSISQVEEAKSVLRLVPIWVTCLIYGIAFAQISTFFTKQGGTVDRLIGSSFQIPAASLQSFTGLSIVLLLPVYDRFFVPIARFITGKSSGITMLQRIGCGIFVSVISMVVAALIEKKRLKIALDFGLVDIPEATVPMSVWWLLPQYILFGIADVFTIVGMQEFFYDQVPDGLRSLGLALYSCVIGVGSFLSSFLISTIEKATSGGGRDSWFSNNLNRAHLDYFYLLLAGLSTIELVVYLYFSKHYIYSRASTI